MAVESVTMVRSGAREGRCPCLRLELIKNMTQCRPEISCEWKSLFQDARFIERRKNCAPDEGELIDGQAVARLKNLGKPGNRLKIHINDTTLDPLMFPQRSGDAVGGRVVPFTESGGE